MTFEKHAVVTAQGPKAIGPYSLGIQTGNLLFISGQLGLDPVTGSLVEGGVEAQTRQALMNLKAILEAGHAGLANVVKTTVFLKNMSDFAAMNQIYAEFFSDTPPARSAIEVAALPKGGLVEIEAIAVL